MRPMGSMRPACFILFAALCVAARAADVTWDAVVRLTTNSASQVTGYSGQHSVAVDAAGDVHVTWLDQRNVPYQVWYRRYDASTSAWLAETALTTRPANCFRPGIACDSAGNVHVVWHVENWLGPGVWYKRHDAADQRWDPDTLVDTTTTSQLQQYPSAASMPGPGRIAVAWYGLPDTGMYTQVFLRERDPVAGWDSAMQVTSASVSHDKVSVAAGRNGNIAVAWIGRDFGNDYNQVYCRRRVGGTWQGTELVSDIPLGLSQYSPCAAFDPGGAIHFVWHGRSMMNTYQQVFHRECRESGWSGIDSISGVRTYQQEFPSVACDAVGRCHTVWCSKAGSEHTQLVYGQRDTNGVWSSPVILTGLESGAVSYPSIICDSDSGIHIVWHDASSGNQDVYYLRGVIPGAGLVETCPTPLVLCPALGATVVRCGSLRQPSGMLFDACGRATADPRPGVYFIRAPGGRRLTRVVVAK